MEINFLEFLAKESPASEKKLFKLSTFSFRNNGLYLHYSWTFQQAPHRVPVVLNLCQLWSPIASIKYWKHAYFHPQWHWELQPSNDQKINRRPITPRNSDYKWLITKFSQFIFKTGYQIQVSLFGDQFTIILDW